jgi:hypothetical protein
MLIREKAQNILLRYLRSVRTDHLDEVNDPELGEVSPHVGVRDLVCKTGDPDH